MKEKKMGMFLLTLFVTGTIVGSGIYMLPAALAKLGSIGLFSWILTSIGAIFLALVFAKMSRIKPVTGGPYAYAHEEFGNLIGYQTAYCYWIAAWVGNTSLIPPTIGYLSVFFPFVHKHNLITGLGLLWLFAIINLFGVKKVGIFNAIATFIKFMPVIIVACGGWFYFNVSYITQNFNISNQSSISAFTFAATLTLWSFVGVEAATVPASSVIKPEKTIPVATITGTLIAAIAYIVTCTLIMGMIPMKELAESVSPFADAGTVIIGTTGCYIIAIGALFSLFGGLNSWTLLASQVAMASADDNLFPKIFAKKNKFEIPIYGIIITAILSSTLLICTDKLPLEKEFEVFILAATALTVITYLYTSVAEIIHMLRNKTIEKHPKTNTTIAIIGCIFSIFAIMSSSKEVIYYVISILLIGIAAYPFLISKKRLFSAQTAVK